MMKKKILMLLSAMAFSCCANAGWEEDFDFVIKDIVANQQLVYAAKKYQISEIINHISNKNELINYMRSQSNSFEELSKLMTAMFGDKYKNLAMSDNDIVSEANKKKTDFLLAFDSFVAKNFNDFNDLDAVQQQQQEKKPSQPQEEEKADSKERQQQEEAEELSVFNTKKFLKNVNNGKLTVDNLSWLTIGFTNPKNPKFNMDTFVPTIKNAGVTEEQIKTARDSVSKKCSTEGLIKTIFSVERYYWNNGMTPDKKQNYHEARRGCCDFLNASSNELGIDTDNFITLFYTHTKNVEPCKGNQDLRNAEVERFKKVVNTLYKYFDIIK